MSGDRHLAPLVRRIQMMVARGTIARADDSTKAQSLQVDLLADETHDEVERFHGYGFTSKPHPGAEVVMVFPGGLRSHGIAIGVEDRRYRMTGLADGEVAFHDDLGQSIVLKRDGIHIVTTLDITVEATNVKVIADRVDLGGEGGMAVARVGDTVEGGVITSGSETVFAA